MCKNIVFFFFFSVIIIVGGCNMNYIKCPNCGKQISSKATGCLYCGISKNIIDQELKMAEMKKEKELPSELEGFYQNHKQHILLLEIFIIIVVAIIYAASYLPKIMEYSRTERLNNMIEKCSSYGGNWNIQNQVCETELGIIDMK